MTTPILGITEISGNQQNQYVTANAAFRALEASTNEFINLDLSAGDVILTESQFTAAYAFVSVGNAVARVLTVPASKRAFTVRNAGTANLSVTLGTSTIVLAADSSALLLNDGTANGLYAVAGGGGGGGAVWGGITGTLSDQADLQAALDAKADTSALGTMATQNANAVAITGGTASGITSLGVAGDITFTGTGRRLKGDFSNATLADRVMVQTSVIGGSTTLALIPDSTGSSCGFQVYAYDTVTDSPRIQFNCSPTAAVIAASNANGAGVFVPMDFYTGGLSSASFLTNGSFSLNRSGAKILAQMSDAAVANNLTFQSSVTNGFTVFNIAPNGSSTISGFNTWSASDLTNAGYIGISSQSTDYRLSVGITGAGAYKPLTIRMGAIIVQAISTAGDVGFGVTSPTTECKLQVSNGIKVGNTANANTDVFDWYEEGTFTPTAIGHLTPGVGTYSTQQGRYTRKGNTVTIVARMAWSAHTGTGNLQVASFPFTSAPNPRLSLQIYANSLVVGAGKQLSNVLEASNTIVSLLTIDLAGGASASLPMDTAVTELIISGTYFVS